MKSHPYDEEKANIIRSEAEPMYHFIRDYFHNKRAASVIMAISAYLAEFTLNMIDDNPGMFDKDHAISVLAEQTMAIIDVKMIQDPKIADNLRKNN